MQRLKSYEDTFNRLSLKSYNDLTIEEIAEQLIYIRDITKPYKNGCRTCGKNHFHQMIKDGVQKAIEYDTINNRDWRFTEVELDKVSFLNQQYFLNRNLTEDQVFELFLYGALIDVQFETTPNISKPSELDLQLEPLIKQKKAKK